MVLRWLQPSERRGVRSVILEKHTTVKCETEKWFHEVVPLVRRALHYTFPCFWWVFLSFLPVSVRNRVGKLRGVFVP